MKNIRYIYESPDKGKTIYRREFGKDEREEISIDEWREESYNVTAITKEEARDIFLRVCKEMGKFWSNVEGHSTEEKIDGVIFSILNIFDGTNFDFPACDIVLRPHPEDKTYCKLNGENYYEDGMAINNNIMLHDIWYKY